MIRSTFTPLVATLIFGTAVVACGDDDETTTTTTTTTTTGSGGSGAGGMTTTSSGGGGAGGGTCSNVQVATDAGLTSLVAAVEQAGLTQTIDGLENGTIFAPTNDAFAALLGVLGNAGLSSTLTDYTPEQLGPILTYHVADSVIDSAAAISVAGGAGEFDTLGGTVEISGNATDGLVLDGSELSPANINLMMVDVPACNGTIVHVIDAVILPSITDVVVSQPDYQELEDLIVTSDGTETIVGLLDGYATPGTPALDYTLFAPTNDAITSGLTFLMNNGGVPDAAGLTPILTYHVVPSFTPSPAALALPANSSVPTQNGANLTVSGGAGVTITEGLQATANVTIIDIVTSNGVIHRVDQILVPPGG